MEEQSEAKFCQVAFNALPQGEATLLAALHQFTAERMQAAERCRERAVQALQAAAAAEPDLHAFLRECWEALDGLAREVNVCMYHAFPGAGLFPPTEMTRQCTFYMVRKKLHESPQTSEHPVSRLLWERTREAPDEAYERLSFLYNLSLFFPLPIPDGKGLPGTCDLPESVRGIVKGARIERCDLPEGTQAIVDWLTDFADESYRRLAGTLVGDDR